METEPYKTFKTFLDTIIKMPEDLKNKLAEEFEKKRLEKEVGSEEKKEPTVFESIFQMSDKDKEVENLGEKKEPTVFESIFGKDNLNKEVENLGEKKEPTIFESLFQKSEADKAEADKAEADKAEADKAEEQPQEKKEPTIFDNFFSKEQTNELLNRFSPKPEPKLSMANAPQNRCVIRGW